MKEIKEEKDARRNPWLHYHQVEGGGAVTKMLVSLFKARVMDRCTHGEVDEDALKDWSFMVIRLISRKTNVFNTYCVL